MLSTHGIYSTLLSLHLSSLFFFCFCFIYLFFFFVNPEWVPDTGARLWNHRNIESFGISYFYFWAVAYHSKFCRTTGEHQAQGIGGWGGEMLALQWSSSNGNKMLQLHCLVMMPLFSCVGNSQKIYQAQGESIFTIAEIFLMCCYLSMVNVH